MNRRNFLGASMAAAAWATGLRSADAAAPWQAYDLTYSVVLPETENIARLWLPLPDSRPGYQEVEASHWQSNASDARVARKGPHSVRLLQASWAGPTVPQLQLTTRVQTRDRVAARAGRASATPAELSHYLRPSLLIPVDGIVKSTADEIVPKTQDVDVKARAIYDWVVDNSFRDPKVRGCGRGDIRFMLETGDLGGKCADINSLFVGLARASGIPAREAFGIRVGESRFNKSLGKTGDISAAQHCRAEYYSPVTGWTPVDAADVRKVILEEGLALDSAEVKTVRDRLFGFWEMNWVELNHGTDLRIATGTPDGVIHFLMYPYAEIGGVPRDSLDAKSFRYTINSAKVMS